MGKREQMISTIKKYLRNCYTSSSVYVYGNIPKDKYLNACGAYAGNVDYNNVFGLIDETLFGSAKTGMLFTDKGYYSDTSSGGEFNPYKDCTTFKSLPSGYNVVAFNELVTALYEIETDPSGLDIAIGILDTVLDLLDD